MSDAWQFLELNVRQVASGEAAVGVRRRNGIGVAEDDGDGGNLVRPGGWPGRTSARGPGDCEGGADTMDRGSSPAIGEGGADTMDRVVVAASWAASGASPGDLKAASICSVDCGNSFCGLQTPSVGLALQNACSRATSTCAPVAAMAVKPPAEKPATPRRPRSRWGPIAGSARAASRAAARSPGRSHNMAPSPTVILSTGCRCSPGWSTAITTYPARASGSANQAIMRAVPPKPGDNSNTGRRLWSATPTSGAAEPTLNSGPAGGPMSSESSFASGAAGYQAVTRTVSRCSESRSAAVRLVAVR